ncbi:hypothetical protein M2165_000785 [Variovorax sp. TBS-050B]|nr:hypothetical protein [Variovorax sp. TBS-050B]
MRRKFRARYEFDICIQKMDAIKGIRKLIYPYIP